MFDAQQYRTMAAEANRRYQTAPSSDYKLAWLKIAEGYHCLADCADVQKRSSQLAKARMITPGGRRRAEIRT